MHTDVLPLAVPPQTAKNETLMSITDSIQQLTDGTDNKWSDFLFVLLVLEPPVS